MLQIIHTADLHIGAPIQTTDMPNSTAMAIQRNALEVFRSICSLAVSMRVHAVVIAGDLFNTLTPDRELVAEVAAQIASAADVQFIIAPGNHDPRELCTAWTYPKWPANAFIFPDQTMRPHTPIGAPITFWGYAWSTREDFTSPLTHWSVPEKYSSSFNVIVAHASERRSQPPAWKVYAGFDARTVSPKHLDYIALGHLHHWNVSVPSQHPTLCYPGSPAPTSSAELGERSVAVVTFTEDGTTVDCRATPSIEFHRDIINLRESSTLAPLKQALVSKYGLPPDRTVLNLAIIGSPPDAVRDQLQSLIDRHRPSFLHLAATDMTASLEGLTKALATDPNYKQFIDELDTAIDESETPELKQLYLTARTAALMSFMSTSCEPRIL